MAGPSANSLVGEAIFDLANDTIRDQTWIPSQLNFPNASHSHNFETLDKSLPFVRAKKLLLHLPLCHTFCDGYIDDLIAMAVDIADAVERDQQALPFSSHCIFRPLHPQDNPIRKDTLSLRKLSGEGRPEETKTVLSWEINTRLFTISLAEDKYKRWKIDTNLLKAL